MIKNKHDLSECLRYEQALYGNRRINSFLPRISEAGLIWKYIILLRKCEYYLNCNKKISFAFFKYRFKKIGLKLGFNIPFNVIDKGLLIYHAGNLVLNAKSIGKNFSVAGTDFIVVKGQNSEKAIIGDDVSLGMNVTIIGGVHIANKTAIGAGSVVTKSFTKENTTIAGNPAKIINPNEGSTSWGGWQNHFSK